jgi:DNA-directed RNA polymerase specialized sigma24 family protein
MDRPDRSRGPHVDPPRLQPDNPADKTAEALQLGQVSAWLDDPTLAAEEERLRRLQADEELLLALQLNKFSGPAWDRFRRELARYGLGVLTSWIQRGAIYAKVQALTGFTLGRPLDGWPDRQTAEDLATDTVVEALNYFRDRVLKTSQWQSSGGASLGTFFIGQCLFRFSNIYRSALRAEIDRINAAVKPMAELPEDEFEAIKGIEETVVARDHVAEALARVTTPRAREAIFLSAVGFTQEEIANRLGLSNARQIENMIAYQHRLLSQQKRASS